MCAVDFKNVGLNGCDSSSLKMMRELDLRLADAQLPRVIYLSTEDRGVVSHYLNTLIPNMNPDNLRNAVNFLISITSLNIQSSQLNEHAHQNSIFLERLVKICKDALARSEKSNSSK